MDTKIQIPLFTGLGLIVLPLIFGFIGGAARNSIIDGLATFTTPFFEIFIGPSLLIGAVLLAVAGWRAMTASRRR